MVKITYPDGSIEEKENGITPGEIAEGIGRSLYRDALAARVGDKLVDLDYKINEDAKVEIVTFDSQDGKYIYWHSSSHILAAAVKKLYPQVKFGIGPPIDEGFYYDFDNIKISDDDLEKIEEQIKEIIKSDIKFERMIVPKEKAGEIFKDEPYQLELLEEIEDPEVSIYKLGEVYDMCRGPHVPSTGKIGVVKLLKIAGAYWRGDSKKPMLTRIYAMSLRTSKEMNAYIDLRKKAQERDHRRIGTELDLYSFHEAAPGMPFFHPKGMVIWNELLKFWRDEHKKAGYVEVKTPIILNKELWEKSGHWDKYRENMYFTEIDDSYCAVKPMNCPGGILIYKVGVKSYRDLPLRVSEVGLVHRHELSGVLSGLFRVRAFHQDDAHIYMTQDHIKDEIAGVIRLTDKMYKAFGFEYEVELSTRPENSMGSDEQWEAAESGLKDALDSLGLEYRLNPGDGAFYGPKIDYHIKDALGRTWQCGTIQLDMTMPEKFDLNYVGDDNSPHRVVMIHRTIYGSLERFMGILVEHYAGVFPVWLSPIQVKIIPVSDRNLKYAENIKNQLLDADVRVEVDYSSNTVEYKVRNSQLEKVPYILTVGDKEEKAKSIAIRDRKGEVEFGVKINDFIKNISNEIEKKK